VPNKLRTPCTVPGCPRLAIAGTGRCERHKRPPWVKTRRSPHGWSWEQRRLRVLLRDGYRCVYCGGRAQVVDHIKARAFGGTDDEGNLVACCKACNEKKGREEARAGRTGTTPTIPTPAPSAERSGRITF